MGLVELPALTDVVEYFGDVGVCGDFDGVNLCVRFKAGEVNFEQLRRTHPRGRMGCREVWFVG